MNISRVIVSVLLPQVQYKYGAFIGSDCDLAAAWQQQCQAGVLLAQDLQLQEHK